MRKILAKHADPLRIGLAVVVLAIGIAIYVYGGGDWAAGITPIVEGQKNASGMIDRAIQRQFPNYKPSEYQPTVIPIPR